MDRRTIANLSRELGVSRPTVYKAMKDLHIENTGKELSLSDWVALKAMLERTAKNSAKNVRGRGTGDGNSEKKDMKYGAAKVDGEKYQGAAGALIAADLVAGDNGSPISGQSGSSLNGRLEKARQEFDFNKQMIAIFQGEIAEYYKINGKTTAEAGNGTPMSIPAVVNLEKYIKLNIALSKLISEIEGDLDLSVDGDEDPCG